MFWFLYASMIALDTLQVGAHSLDTLSANLVMFEVVFFEKDQTKLGICGNSSYALLIRYIVGRGFLTPHSVIRISPFISHPTPHPQPLFKIFPHFLQLPPPLLFLLPCFFDWMGDCTTFDVLFYLLILWIYTYGALVH